MRHRANKARDLARLHAAALLFLVNSCAVGPDYKTPEDGVSQRYASASYDEASFSGEPVLQDWWSTFRDAELEGLVREAVSNNRSVAVSVARVVEARAGRRESRSNLFPTAIPQGNYSARKQSAFGAPGIPANALKTEVFNVGVDVSWEIDFFGRLRRLLEADTALQEASEEDLRDAVRMLTAELADNYFQLRGVQAQRRIAEKNAKAQAETVRLTRVMVREGQGMELDTARADAQLQTTLASIPLFEASEKAYIHHISVLLGREPATLMERLSGSAELPRYDGPVALGVPSELLSRRPDVRAAERRLAAATAGIGVARADLYPRVTFSGALGLEADTLSHLTRSGTDTYSLLPSIRWAAFDLGTVRSRIEAADARAHQALSAFEQTVLSALEETETAVVRFSKERSRRDFLKQAFAQSSRAADLAGKQYREGLVDLLTVLDAERVALQAESELSNSDTAILSYLVLLYRALGGGWDELKIEDWKVTPSEPPILSLQQ